MCFAPQRRALFWTSQTAKSGPELVCFVHFDLEMCFAPQRRALFRELNFQKWSEPLVFLTFWLGNVLRATTACTFLTSQLPKVVRDRQFLTLLTSKCASRHNGGQFFISHLASWLRTRRFSEPTFRPSGAPNHWKKHTASRLSYLFRASASSFLLLFFLQIFLFSLPLPCSAFHLSHIVGSLTSKTSFGYSRMRSEGSRFTLGPEGWGCGRSMLPNRSQPFAGDRVRPVWPYL